MNDFTEFKFKRGNFFTGLMATPQFWNDIQEYHFEKEQLYNRLFHGAGVIPGILEEFKVSSVKKGGTITVVISSGFAVDGLGRPIFLYAPNAKVIDYKKYKLPETIYLSLSYNEVLDDYYQNKENPDFQGYQKKIETAVIELTTKQPDNSTKIELARIRLEEDENGEISEITEPDNPACPQINELDIRFVPWVTSVKKGLSPYLKKYLIDIFEETKITASQASEGASLSGLRDLHTVSLTSKMLVECETVSFDNIINIIYPLYDVFLFIIQEMLEKDRKDDKRFYSSREAFTVFRLKIHELGDMIKYFDNTHEMLDSIMKTIKVVLDSMRLIIETKKVTFTNISLISYDLPRILVVDEVRYTLIEYMDFSDHSTENKFNFKIEVKDYTSSNQQFTYPDGVHVKDVVKRYADGRLSFTLRNMIKKRDLLIVRRMDIFHGNYKVDVELNGEKATNIIVDGYDTKHRWRNSIAVIKEELINDEVNTFSFVMGKNGKDNFGKMWFYQKI